ncbi:hypothetical protein D3C87_1585730 [compost metagenome]
MVAGIPEFQKRHERRWADGRRQAPPIPAIPVVGMDAAPAEEPTMKRTDLIILALCIVAGFIGVGLGKARSGLGGAPPPGIAPLHGASR